MAVTEIILEQRDVNDIMDIVRGLRSSGCVQGKDFDFSYNKAEVDESNFVTIRPKHTKFTFYTDKWATWFTLKYV